MTNQYELRIYDTTLLSFSLKEEGIEGLSAEILSVNDADKKLLPLDLSLTDEGLVPWLRRRVIPKNRAFVEEILKTLHLSVNDTKGIIDVCKGLSLNDCYWIVPQGFEGTFAEYNLYENRFSEILSLVAYTGIGQTTEAFTTSPELTTNGMLPKAWWLIENGGIFLYKGGTSGASNTGNEPFAEYYAAQVARTMGLACVDYDLENWKGILASKCALFTDMETSFVPIGRIVRAGGLKAVLQYYRELGGAFYENVRSMLVFDAVVYNEDRHFGNFGLLRDNRSGEILQPAPIFDHGISLFNYARHSDFADLDAYTATRTPAYPDVTFESIVGEVCGKTQAAQLRRLIGFKFKHHPSINWPDGRLEATEQHIQRRVQRLLEVMRTQAPAKKPRDRDER